MADQVTDILKRIVETTIFTHEGAYALSVRADFREGLARQTSGNDRIAYCRRWMGMYTGSVRVVRGAG